MYILYLVTSLAFWLQQINKLYLLTFLFTFHRNYVPILYHFPRVQRVICRNSQIFPASRSFGILFGTDPFKFHQDLWHQQTRVHDSRELLFE